MNIEVIGEYQIKRYTVITFCYIVSHNLVRILNNSLKLQSASQGVVDLLFLPPAIIISLIIIFGPKYLPITVIPTLINTIRVDRPFIIVLSLGVINPLIFGLAGYIIHRYRTGNGRNLVQYLLHFILSSHVAAIFVSMLAINSFIIAGIFQRSSFIVLTLDWFIGDALGIMTLTPIIILVYYYVDYLLNGKYENIAEIYPSSIEPVKVLIGAISILIILAIQYIQVKIDPNLIQLNIVYFIFLPITLLSITYGVFGSIIGNTIHIFIQILLYQNLMITDIVNYQLLSFSMITINLILGVVISNNNQIESKIKSQRDNLKQIINGITDAVIALNENYDILEVNPKFSNIINIPKDKLRGENIINFLPNDQLSKYLDFKNRLLTDLEAEVQTVLVNSDGISVPVDIIGIKMTNGHIILTIKDIQEQIRLREIRKNQREEIYQADKMDALGKLAGNISHDFNNNLLAIQGNAEVLKSLIDDPKANQILDDILTATDRSQKLTKQILTFSGRSTQEPEVIDLNKIIEELYPFLSHLCGEAVQLHYYKENEDLYAKVSSTSVEQILMNLVVNAVEAIEHSGVISIETRLRQNKISNNWVEIRIKDTGKGIDVGDESKIFDPFYSTKENNTGLGLSIVYTNVINHNGNIRFESEPNDGTEFIIQFPFSEYKVPIHEKEELQIGEDLTNLLVLLLEDNELVRRGIKQMLDEHEIGVVEANNRATAIEEAKINNFNLIISDIVMPQEYGTEIVKEIKAIEKYKEVPVIFMSGYYGEEMVSKQMISDNYFIAKPFKKSDLLTKISQIINSQEGQT